MKIDFGLLLAALERLGQRPEPAELIGPIQVLAAALLHVDRLTRESTIQSAVARLRGLGLTKAAAEALLRSALTAAAEAAQEAASTEPDPVQQEQRLAELRDQAKPVLEAEDPLALVAEAIEARGYGGEPRAPMIAYIAATSRVLAMRPGSLPVHLLLTGSPSAGKNYAWSVARSLLPKEAWHAIDAGSPRVLIYDPAPLRHRVVVFAEADSLPSGEDNPAASALRNTLQDHYLHYGVVVKDPDTGRYKTQEIVKPGPTVLITTATRRLGEQLDSRLFTLEVPEDQPAIQQALKKQAEIELSGSVKEPDAALVALQGYLQLLAPMDVVVPFVENLGDRIGQSCVGPRIHRDFARLISLIKAVTVLRHHRRGQDPRGRWAAEIEDYRTVYDLVGDMYQGTTTGASQKVRQVVETVGILCARPSKATGRDDPEGIRVRDIGRTLELGDSAAWRRAKVAIKNGWLINREERKHRPARLIPGDPLPAAGGLPKPEDLVGPMQPPVKGREPQTDLATPEFAPSAQGAMQTGTQRNTTGNGASLQFASPDQPPNTDRPQSPPPRNSAAHSDYPLDWDEV